MRNFLNDVTTITKPDLQLFGLNTNTTGSEGLSAEMKTYYSDYMIDNAVPKLVHEQFAQKQPIPKNGGKQIEFRKFSPLPKLTKGITEGVTPDGQSLNVSTVTAQVKQYGGYITISDMLKLTAIDNNMLQATKLLGAQAGATLDTITREVLNGGTSVQYGDSNVINARHLLKGGETDGSNNYLTVDAIRMAVRFLKTQNAEKIGDSYVAIIHPDVSYDLMSDPAWQNVKTYCDPEDMYEGEIGKIAGVRFVETTEAKIFHADDLTSDRRTLTIKSDVNNSTTVTVAEAVSENDAKLLTGKLVIIDSAIHMVISATAGAAGSATITLSKSITTSSGAVIYPGGAGAKGRDVYSTLILAENAYGVTEIEGGGLQHIVKQLGSGGTEDALNQRATVGWKATRAAERLVEAYMRRIETASTFESGAN